MDAGDDKACPFCAETIKAAAIVCKHCGLDLPREKTKDELDMERLGIVIDSDRYRWRGSFFKNLSDAIAYAEQAPSLSHADQLRIQDEHRDQHKPNRFKWWLWVPLGAVAAFFALGAMESSTPEGRARSTERRAIELCWKEHERKSFDASTKQFVAGACERMETDFRAKWGVNP